MARFLYDRVSSDIMTMVSEEEYALDDKLPTLKEMAARFGASSVTVRKAVDRLKAEGFLRSLRGSGVFVNRLPAGGRYFGKRDISLIMPQFDGTSGQLRMTTVVSARLEQLGYRVSIIDTTDFYREERDILIKVGESNPAGLIYYPLNFNNVADYLVVLQSRNIPIVIVDKEDEGLSLPCVLPDNRDGAKQAVRHLLDYGHREIAFVALYGFEEASSIRSRYLGYCNALLEGKARIRHEFVTTRLTPSGREDPAAARALLARLKSQGVTAIFAVSDSVALFLYRQMQAMGWRVPEDMSLVGFDNVEACEQIECPLTTVAQDFHAMGVRACKMITDLIAGKKLMPMRQQINTKLIKRKSVLRIERG